MVSAPQIKLSPEQFQSIARALAEPRRFAMLQQIAREHTVRCSALSAHECLSPATISHHLKELQETGLVDSEREGRSVKLSLRREVWDAYLRELGSL